MQYTQTQKLLEEGKLIKLATFLDGAVDTIKYVDKHTSQPAEFHQIKLGVRLQAGYTKKLVDAVMRVKEGDDPKKVLADMDLKPGSCVILDVDSLTKNAPAKKGAESTWNLRVYGAYNLEDEKS